MTRHRSVVSGMLLALAAFALFAVQDAMMKWLVVRLPLAEIMALRSVMIVIAVLALKPGRQALRDLRHSNSKPALLARGVFLLVAWLLLFSASARLTLADLTTLYFIAPVIAVALSGLVLKERIGPSRWAAVGAGFAGVLIAAGPLAGLAPGPVAMALAAALCFGVGIVLTAWIVRTESSFVQLLSTNGIFVIGLVLPAVSLWRPPDGPQFLIVLGSAVVSGLGQFLLFEAFRSAPASAVAPVEYSGLVWASVLGYAIWGDVPAPATIAGAALIVAGSLMLIWSERLAQRPPMNPDVPI